MGAKRALIVDDSKSARMFLSRILEKYEIDVDTAESAEQAIEYLVSQRPDVIFMDHLMPGMDGFQAVQAIKNNPRTATIPIMMYTSQEGELYLGQARALGAVGVLPKQIKPADVSKVLYQLHLVPDRRSAEQTSFKAANLEDPGGPAVAPPSQGGRPLSESALREHFAELRRAMMATLDSQSERFAADVRAAIQQGLPSPPPPPKPAAQPWPWIAVALALLAACALAALWWREAGLRESLAAELAKVREVAARASAAPATRPAPRNTTAAPADAAVDAAGAPGPSAGVAAPLVVTVPYGEDALGGARLEAVRELLARLAAEGYRGVVEVRTHAGRFCLVGNPSEGFSLAPDEMSFARCELVGNPVEDALSPAQRIPLAFANLAGEYRHRTQGALDVQVEPGDEETTAMPYPAVADALTAGEWNRAARANNRIEIRLR